MNSELKEKRIIRSCPGVEGTGKRLDKWLADRFTYRSRSEWQHSIESGEILLNGRTTRPSRILHGDEQIEFRFPDREEPEVRTDYQIIAETPEYFVVNKPGDLPVHPSGRFFNHTLLMLMRVKYGELYIVNRLDRETSGIVLMAKDNRSAGKLAKVLSAPSTEKRYIVYVHGVFPGYLHAAGWLSADRQCAVRKKRLFSFEKPVEESEDCDTEFFLRRQAGNFSEVECLLHTGRLHQIRATLHSLHYPVVGDKMYGLDPSVFCRFSDGCMTEEDKKSLLLERQALHAYSFTMTDPFDGTVKRFTAPLPEELAIGDFSSQN